ncbi:MAG: hypothetical protein R3B99_35410 [Polyangiales bacterium]
MGRVVAFEARGVVAFVDRGEVLVRLVDHAQIPRPRFREASRDRLGSRELTPDREEPLPFEGVARRLRDLAHREPEEAPQLLAPLPDQRLRRDEQDLLRALGAHLRDHQARLDRLSEADLVREDATALWDAREREDHRVDLVRVRVDAPGALRGRVATLFVGRATANELLGEPAATNGMHGRGILPAAWDGAAGDLR